jgi:NADPH-dependent curcumin reductase CurA
MSDDRPTLYQQLSGLNPLSPKSRDGKEEKLPTVVSSWVLQSYPSSGIPTHSDAKLVTAPFPTHVPYESLLIRVNYLTVDPYLRREFKQGFGTIGKVLRTEGVGTVIRSEHPSFNVGDKVQGFFGWTDFAVVDASAVTRINPEWKQSYCLGVLGMPGATAYYGLFHVCQAKPGDIVFVSAASGAVGAAVGQMAKLSGCTVIGSVGSADKVKYTASLGFDHVINYKNKDTETLIKEIKEIAPGGINCYFDGTGGPVTDAVISSMVTNGRVAVCGQIHYYGQAPPARAGTGDLALFPIILAKQLTVQGFMVGQFKPWDTALNRIAGWIKSGKITVTEDMADGIGNMFDAFLSLYSGQNLGKKLIRLAH